MSGTAKGIPNVAGVKDYFSQLAPDPSTGSNSRRVAMAKPDFILVKMKGLKFFKGFSLHSCYFIDPCHMEEALEGTTPNPDTDTLASPSSATGTGLATAWQR